MMNTVTGRIVTPILLTLLVVTGCKTGVTQSGNRPLATITAAAQAAFGSTVSLDGSSSSDPGGAALTYRWMQISGPAVTLANITGATTTFVAPAVAAKVTIALVTNNGKAESLPAIAEITMVESANKPVANAGQDKTVAGGVAVNLAGSGSGGEGTLSYAWKQVAGEHVVLTGAESANCSFSAPNLRTILGFTLTVSDGVNTSEPDKVVVTVDANSLPLARAGDDKTVLPGALVTLDGSWSSDPNGDALTYAWTQTAGANVTLSAADAAMPTFTAPQQETKLTFQLIVSDGRGNSQADLVDITVNTAPVASAGNMIQAVGGTTVTLDGSGSSDPEGTVLTHLWTQLSGTAVTLSDSSAAKPTFTAPSQAGTLFFQLVVKDTYATSQPDSVTVFVVTNRTPTANGGGNRSVLNGNPTVLEGTATDPDGDDIIDYKWSVIGYPPNGDTYQLTGQNSPTASFTPLVKGDYSISFMARDATAWGQADIITVHAENNPPTATVGDSKTMLNTVTTTLTGGGSDPDGDTLSYAWTVKTAPQNAHYTLDGAQTQNPTFTPMSKGAYTLQLTVSDGEDSSLPVTMDITVTNNPPAVDAGADQQVERPNVAQIVATGTDRDNETLTYGWRIKSTEPSGLTGTFGNAALASTTFTPDAVGRYTLEVTATDTSAAKASDVVEIIAYTLPTNGQFIFVTTTGNDNNGTCGTLAAPCLNLSTAVKLADSSGKAVAMAEGSYVDPQRSITIPPGVKIYGGYDPSTWVRDVKKYKTVLRTSPLTIKAETGAMLTDGKDNDCDGYVDKPACTPSFETCDNKDNDCDGKIDNDDVEQDACGDTLEPNNDSASAQAIDFATRYRGLLLHRDNVDWFKFTVGSLPPASADWVLYMAVRFYSTMPTSTSIAYTMSVYRGDPTNPSNQIHQDTINYPTRLLEYKIPAAQAQAGTYYIKMETSYANDILYELDTGFKHPSATLGSSYNRQSGTCQDSYVLGITGAKPQFAPGDENVISGLTVYGHQFDIRSSVPWTNWIDAAQSAATPWEWGATIYCNECALTLEDSVLHESQYDRRLYTAENMDASAPLMAYNTKGLPLKVTGNDINLGYTRFAVGINLFNNGDVVIRNNRFKSKSSRYDPHVDKMHMIYANFHEHGTQQLIVDRNRFELDTTASQTSCSAIRIGQVNYQKAHTHAPLYMTNNLFLVTGGGTAYVIYLHNAGSSETSPASMIINNSFHGAGAGNAVYPYDSHHGMTPVVLVNNYFEDFTTVIRTGWIAPYLANNVFHNVTWCTHLNYSSRNCGGDDCGECIANLYCGGGTLAQCKNGGWVNLDGGYTSRFNTVAKCPVRDAQGGDFRPMGVNPCVDRGFINNIPTHLPQAPSWMTYDFADQSRPLDYPGVDCPANTTCDFSDVGAYELQP